MKEMILQTKVKVCCYDELSEQDRLVVDAARGATANSYAIYSHFNVGAAVRLANGEIVCGSNQENAAYVQSPQFSIPMNFKPHTNFFNYYSTAIVCF